MSPLLNSMRNYARFGAYEALEILSQYPQRDVISYHTTAHNQKTSDVALSTLHTARHYSHGSCPNVLRHKNIQHLHSARKALPAEENYYPKPLEDEVVRIAGHKYITKQLFNEMISQHPNLRRLHLVSNALESGVQALDLPTSLEELYLSWSDLNIRSIWPCWPLSMHTLTFSQCQNMKRLHLSGDNVDFFRVELPASLEELKVYSTSSVTGRYLGDAISRCPQLKRLLLSQVKLDIEGVCFPASLEELELSVAGEITHQSLKEALSRCQSLKFLHLSGISESFEGVPLPSSLEELNLSCYYSLTDQTLSNLISQCQNLKHLNIYCEDLPLKEIVLPASLETFHINSQQVEGRYLDKATAHRKNVEIDFFDYTEWG